MMSMMLGPANFGISNFSSRTAALSFTSSVHVPAMTTDNLMSPSSPENTYGGPISPLAFETSAGSSPRGAPKACGVCGDVAKSMHFGGLSCDSCKAFFRRSVQNNAFKGFSCPYDKQCVIAVSSRKACQYCRFEKCLSIGMEKSWVMTEEERKRMMQQRHERKAKQAKDDMSAKQQGADNYSLTEEDRAEISLIVSLYQKAYAEIPYDDCNQEATSELTQNTSVGTSSVLGPWMTFCKRIAYFFSLFRDFAELCSDDQFVLLKTAITSAGIIMGSVVYDGQRGKWSPRVLRTPDSRSVPQVSIKNVEKLVPTDLFIRVDKFFRKFQHICIDEKMAIILMLICLYSPELMGLKAQDTVQHLQERYIHILDRYVRYVFKEKSSVMFPKAIVSLADIRELADRTYQMHLKDKNVPSNLCDTRINHGAVKSNDGSSQSKSDQSDSTMSSMHAAKRARLAATGDARDLIYQKLLHIITDQMHISSMKLRAPSFLPFIIHIIKKLISQEGSSTSSQRYKRSLSYNQKVKKIGNKVRVLEIENNDSEKMMHIKEEAMDVDLYEDGNYHSVAGRSCVPESNWVQDMYPTNSNDSMASSTSGAFSGYNHDQTKSSGPPFFSNTFYSSSSIKDTDTGQDYSPIVVPQESRILYPVDHHQPSSSDVQMSPVSPPYSAPSPINPTPSYATQEQSVYSPYSSSSSTSSPEDPNLDFNSSGLTDLEVDVLTELLDCVTSMQNNSQNNAKEVFEESNVKEVIPLQLLRELQRKLCSSKEY